MCLQCEDGTTSAKIGDPLEVNKLSESIARATCVALTKLLDLLAASGMTILAVRATIDQEDVSIELWKLSLLILKELYVNNKIVFFLGRIRSR